MPEKHPRPCVALLLPLKSSPFLSDSSQRGTLFYAKVPRRLHSGKRFQLGTQHQQTWRLDDFSKVFVARASGHHPLGAVGSMVPARAKQIVRFKRGSIKGTHPDCLDPSPVQSWGPKPGQNSRDWKAAQVREIRGDKIGNSLLF